MFGTIQERIEMMSQWERDESAGDEPLTCCLCGTVRHDEKIGSIEEKQPDGSWLPVCDKCAAKG